MWALLEAAMWISTAGLIVILFFVWADAGVGLFGAAVVGGALLAYFNGGGLLGALAAGAGVCVVGAIVSFANFQQAERSKIPGRPDPLKPRSVPCPDCGAEAGAPCVDGPSARESVHFPRTEALDRIFRFI
jgi:hypothetical protein